MLVPLIAIFEKHTTPQWLKLQIIMLHTSCLACNRPLACPEVTKDGEHAAAANGSRQKSEHSQDAQLALSMQACHQGLIVSSIFTSSRILQRSELPCMAGCYK